MRKNLVSILALLAGIVIGVVGSYFMWKPEPTPVRMATVPVVEAVRTATPPPVAEPAVVTPACEDRQYTVVEGDSLWRIAKREFGGRAYLYPLIAEVNFLEDEDMIYPDQVLTIKSCLNDLPELPLEVVKASSVKKLAVSSVASIKKSAVAVVERVEKAVTPAPVAPVSTPVVAVQPAPAPPPAPAPVVAPLPPPAPAPAPAPKVAVAVEEKSLILPPTQAVAQVATPAPSLDRRVGMNTDVPFVRSTPGSAWNSFGVSPIERGNKVDYFHVDQGFILDELPGRVQFEPYVALNATKDSKGYSWNNKVKAEVGVKLVKAFSLGVMNVGTAYASETRRGDGVGSQTESGLMVFTDGWMGWDQPTPSTKTSFLASLPGSSWWSVGNTSPFENGNLIGVVRAEQGVTLVKTNRLSLIPLGWGQVGFDTDDNPWNNRYLYGGGVKASIPWSAGVLSVTGGYECAKERGNRATSSTSNVCGPRVSVDVWTGWRKIGGR